MGGAYSRADCYHWLLMLRCLYCLLIEIQHPRAGSPHEESGLPIVLRKFREFIPILIFAGSKSPGNTIRLIGIP